MDRYKDLTPGRRGEQNLFSFWWPQVKDCGIPVPKTFVLGVPVEVQRAFWLENLAQDFETIANWVKHTVRPGIQKADLGYSLFVKNSVFSGKFRASQCCMATESNLADHICAIAQFAMETIMGYDGCGEFVFRERIPFNERSTACIYNGLPLRPEFRVFYDFDTREVLFVANYWDNAYVRPHLRSKTDIDVWEAETDRIAQEFDAYKHTVSTLVASSMAKVEGLTGPWSVDVMKHDFGSDPNSARFYLIDMAVAEESAYWELRPGAAPRPTVQQDSRPKIPLLEGDA